MDLSAPSSKRNDLDFLKPQNDDSEELATLKTSISGVVERNDPEELAHIKLISVVSYAFGRDQNDDEFIDKFETVLEAAISLYRDSVNYMTLKGLHEVPSGVPRDIALEIGLSALPSKIEESEKRVAELSNVVLK